MADMPHPSIAIPQPLLDKIDEVAAERGWSRSLLVREALRLWLRLNSEDHRYPDRQVKEA